MKEDSPAVRTAHILLVEDNEMDVELTLNAFRELEQRRLREGEGIKCTVSVVRSGQEALDYVFGRGAFANREDHPVPDLILLDLKMPGIDGCEVLRRIKQAPDVQRTPVIMLTSSEEEQDRRQSYRFGANSYLVKPFSFEAFSRMIGTLVS
ncbi:MAG: response regulator, partial [Bacteroidetes bacterium]